MHLLELPLDLILNILAEVVLSGEIAVILPLRQVNRLFDREITRYLAKFRLQDVDVPFGYSPPIVPKSFVFRLVSESVGNQYRGQNEIKTVIHAVTDDLESRLAELKIPSNRPEILQSVCKTALAHRFLWTLRRALVEDGEDGGNMRHRSLGEDKNHESHDIAQSSFIVAVASRYTEVQSAMFQSGVNLDFETRQFGGPLQMAARLGYCDTVEILLKRGATIGRAFEIAASHGHKNTVQLLLDPKYGLKTSGPAYGEAACRAVKNMHLDVATMILERSTKFSKSLRKQICHWAAFHGYDKLVVAMLDSGIDLDGVRCEGTRPLAEAAGRGHLSTVSLLLDIGASNSRPATMGFRRAARAGHIEILEMFLQRGIDMEEDTLLHAFFNATQAGNFASVQFLLDHGLDLHAAGSYWRYYALRGTIWGCKNADMVRWLILNFGLNPDGDDGEPGPSPDGNAASVFKNTSPMSWALERGRPEVVNLLFSLGAKLIDPTSEGFHRDTEPGPFARRQRAALDAYRLWEAKLEKDGDVELWVTEMGLEECSPFGLS